MSSLIPLAGYPCCCRQPSSSSTSSVSQFYCCWACKQFPHSAISNLYAKRTYTTGADGTNPGTVEFTQTGPSAATFYVADELGNPKQCAQGWTVPGESVFINNPQFGFPTNGTSTSYTASVVGQNYISGAQVYFAVYIWPVFLNHIFSTFYYFNGDTSYPSGSEETACSGPFQTVPLSDTFEGSLTLTGENCDPLVEYRAFLL